jgi:general secretion pathway protein G
MHAVQSKLRRRLGFTLIELLVVLAILASLLSLAVPRYFASLERAHETALKHDLAALREAIDRHFADTGRYPERLDDLVDRRYLRQIPLDPISERADTWRTLPPPDPALGAIGDVRSGAQGKAQDGSAYGDW